MRSHTRKLQALAMLAATTLVGRAWAVPVMDGTKDGEYGAALSIQNTNTEFGDGTNGDAINGGGGSEIDGIYARVASGRLYLMVTGNLQTNFDKLEVFIDSETGGINTLNSATYTDDINSTDLTAEWHNNNLLPGGVDAWCCGKLPPPEGGNTENDGALQRMHGLKFDAGFDADHYITVSHGFESSLAPNLEFYASSAHYANLKNGAAGAKSALGMQLAQRGLPRVLRGTTADIDIDGDVDGEDFLIWQRNNGATGPGVNRKTGDISANGTVGPEDLGTLTAKFGFDNDTSTFGADYFKPQTPGVDNSEVLLGPTLPGLAQGALIDKTYAFGPGGATNNAGAGAITRELEFVLPPITAGVDNAADHRNMLNTIGLQMAINNSNVAGVAGGGGAATGDPGAVTTGIELSVPLTSLNTAPGAGAIKVMVFINGSSHNYASNQFSGTGVLQGNLGGDGFGLFWGALHHPTNTLSVNMLDYPGDQFVSVANPLIAAVPEPGSAALMVLAVAGLLGRRRSQR